jgi:hypothetical protein
LWPAGRSSCKQWRLFLTPVIVFVSYFWLVCCLCWRCKMPDLNEYSRSLIQPVYASVCFNTCLLRNYVYMMYAYVSLLSHLVCKYSCSVIIFSPTFLSDSQTEGVIWERLLDLVVYMFIPICSYTEFSY